MKNSVLSILMVGLLSVASLSAFAQGTRTNTGGDKKKEVNKGEANSEQKTPTKIIQYLPGSWSVESVLRGKQEISDNDTLGGDQRLEFNREGRYMSYTDSEMIDSGAYRVNENTSRIYLESDVEGYTQSEWNVWFDKSGLMNLQQTNRNPHAQQFRYVYRRTSTVTSKK